MTRIEMRNIVVVSAVVVGILCLPGASQAQQPLPPPDPATKSQPQPKAKSPPPAAQAGKAPTAAAKEDAAAPTRPGGDTALRQRIDQLEEQLADMQVVIGTLESLGRGGGGGPPAPSDATVRTPTQTAGGGVDQARMDSFETQMRAISDQIEQLTVQVRQLAGRRSEAPLSPPPAVVEPPPSRGAAQAPPRTPGFGSVTVTPGESDPIGRLMTATPLPSPTSNAPTGPQPLPPAAAGASSAKELYETAYGYLLQQDYGAAEVAFEEFLRRHPNDRLTPDAQYWLGESLYVQRRYKPAGQAFLRVIQQHGTNAKVPNSILKLAQSLDQLGQKDCALFEELETRHPNTSADVRTRARALKQRVGC